jgi:hypothetical protein
VPAVAAAQAEPTPGSEATTTAIARRPARAGIPRGRPRCPPRRRDCNAVERDSETALGEVEVIKIDGKTVDARIPLGRLSSTSEMASNASRSAGVIVALRETAEAKTQSFRGEKWP